MSILLIQLLIYVGSTVLLYPYCNWLHKRKPGRYYEMQLRMRSKVELEELGVTRVETMDKIICVTPLLNTISVLVILWSWTRNGIARVLCLLGVCKPMSVYPKRVKARIRVVEGLHQACGGNCPVNLTLTNFRAGYLSWWKTEDIIDDLDGGWRKTYVEKHP